MSPGSRFQPHHIERSGEFTIALPAGQVFPLFSPEGERAWVEGWDPAYFHPAHPSNAPGTIFRTSHQGEETLWLVIRYDPRDAEAEYGRFTPGSRLGTVKVRCHEDAPDFTRVTVVYSLTALTPAGNVVLTELSQAKFASMLRDWRDAIMRALTPRAP